jgi:hypothetical protein
MTRRRITDKRFCYNYKSDQTWTDKRGYKLWRKHEGQWYCNICNTKLFTNPKYHKDALKKWNPIYNKNRLRFKDKQYLLKENPRKGICQSCGKKIGDQYNNCKGEIAIIKETHIHHIQYHPDNILKDTIELCVPCHRKK